MQTVTAFHDLVASFSLAWVSAHSGIGPDAGEWYAAATKLADGFATAALASSGVILAGLGQMIPARIKAAQ